MRPLFKLDKLGIPSTAARLVYRLAFLLGLGLGSLPSQRALLHDLPEFLHVLVGNDLVTHATEHEDRRVPRNERHFRRGVPLLVTQGRERAEDGECAGHEARQREEGVLEDYSPNLRMHQISQ